MFFSADLSFYSVIAYFCDWQMAFEWVYPIWNLAPEFNICESFESLLKLSES